MILRVQDLKKYFPIRRGFFQKIAGWVKAVDDVSFEIEQGNTAQIFHDARHPYTQGLLASLPSRSKRGKRLYSIPGTVPNPAYRPEGCPFHPRCPHAIPTCGREHPKMCDYSQAHLARCPVLFKNKKPVPKE